MAARAMYASKTCDAVQSPFSIRETTSGAVMYPTLYQQWKTTTFREAYRSLSEKRYVQQALSEQIPTRQSVHRVSASR